MAVVAGCVIFHRRQLLLREPRIPPPSFCSFDRSRFFASRSPSSFTLRFATVASAVAAVAVPRLSLFLSFPRALPGVASLSFSPSVANIRNVCRGHATGHQLHDLRFADLASRVHRHIGCALVQHTRGTPVSARVCTCTHAIHKRPVTVPRNDFQ